MSRISTMTKAITTMSTTSEARVNANRINAQKSTGPKTPEGKAVSRANSFKHGLTGEGVVIPASDQEAIQLRVSGFVEDLKPKTAIGLFLVHQVAVMSIRLERCGEQESEVVALRVNKAIRDFDDSRLDEADALFEGLADSPAANLRKLGRTVEGLQKLIEEWTALKDDLAHDHWKSCHGNRLANLRGCKPDDSKVAVLIEYSEAVQGRFDPRQFAQPSLVDTTSRSKWAKGELASIIDIEIAGLTRLMENLDPSEAEEALVEAVAVARLEAAPAVHQIQKYEAAASRAFFRNLKEARLVEAAPALADQVKPPKAKPPATNPVAVAACATLGSFSPPVSEPEPEVSQPPEDDDLTMTPEELERMDAMFGRTPEGQAKLREAIRLNEEKIEALKRLR